MKHLSANHEQELCYARMLIVSGKNKHFTLSFRVNDVNKTSVCVEVLLRSCSVLYLAMRESICKYTKKKTEFMKLIFITNVMITTRS